MAKDKETKTKEKEIETKEKYAMAQDTLAVGVQTANVASFITLGKFLSLFFTGAAFIIVARILGPSSYGIYVLAISLSGFISAFADLSISTSLSKFISEYSAHSKKEEIGQILSNGYIIVAIMALIIAVIIFSLSGIISNYVFGSQANTNIVKLVSFVMYSSILFGVSYSSLCGFGKGKYISLVLLTQAIIQSVISVALAILGFGAFAPIVGLIAGYLFAVALTTIIITTKLKVKFGKPSFRGMKNLLTFSLPLNGYTILRSFTLNISPVVLGIFTSTVVVGNFGVALKTGNIIAVVTTSLELSVLLMFSSTISIEKLKKRLNSLYNSAIYITYLLITPVMFYIALLSKEVSFTLFSSQYLLAPLYLSMICVGTLLWVIATYTINMLIGANKVKEIFMYSIIVFIIEMILLFTLVPIFKGVGLVSLLYFVTPGMLTVLGLRIGKSMQISLDLMKLIKVIVAALISISLILPLLLIFGSNYILILILAAVEQIIVYPIIIAITGAAHKRDLQALKEIVKNIPVINRLINTLTNYSARFAKA